MVTNNDETDVMIDTKGQEIEITDNGNEQLKLGGLKCQGA